MKVWKLLAAIVVVATLSICSPYLLAWAGLIQSLKDSAWIVLAIATIGLGLKMIFGDLISGQFLYYKHGYDMCILTFGAILSNLSLQISADHDLFPGLVPSGPLSHFMFGPTEASKKSNLLLIFFILSLLGTAITAYIAKAVTEPSTNGKSFLSLINFVIGGGFLAMYVLMLITKG